MTKIATALAAALAYAARGWPIFPVALIRQDGELKKKPLVKWSSEPTCDPQRLAAWWLKWPAALPATPTGKRSRLIVLDIDVKHAGPTGFHTLEELGRSILPVTPIAHSLSGGVHVYFADNPEVEIRNSEGKGGLGVALDVRGEGGMIVLPSPGGYTWDPHCNFDTVPLLPAPAWLGHRRRRERPAGERGMFDPAAILDNAITNIRSARDGERHATINREVYSIAGLAAAGALDEGDARHRLSAAVITMTHQTGGDLRKAETDFADAWRDGLAQPLAVRAGGRAGR